MSSDITSRKRPRVEDSVDGTVGGGNELELKRDNVQRDADIWFADGNVVLIAGNVTFRVHKSLLAQHSQVFSDIFTVPQPPDAEIMDGCPVVTVSDSPQDFKHLLVLIFKNQNFFQVATSIPFGMLSAVIRLGHKYNIEKVVEQGLALLKMHFPDRFSDWLDESPALVKLNWTLEDAIDVVHIARLTNTESILPVALYYCCHLETALVEGVQREDGTSVHLSPQDLRRCLMGKKALMLQTAKTSFAIYLPYVNNQCEFLGACYEAWFMDALGGARHFPANFVGFDSLAYDGDHDDEDLCSSCLLVVKARASKAQRRAWRELSSDMQLEVQGWGDDIPWDKYLDEEQLE